MRFALLVLFVVSSFSFTACNKDAKFCDKMKELYGEEMDDCETDALPEIKNQCKDPDAVIDCVLDASDKKEANACYKDKCEKK